MTRELANDVRAAAAALAEAIEAAEAAGLRVQWPGSATGLTGIAISETGRVQAAIAPAPVPVSEVVVDVAPTAVIETSDTWSYEASSQRSPRRE